MKKIVLICSVILLVVLVIIFFIVLPLLRSSPKPPTTIAPTPTQTVPTIIKNVKNQGEADINFSNAINSSRQPYPWYSSLPIQERDYFVYFGIPQKRFFGEIYSLSNGLTPTQIESIKTEAVQKLKEIGVDTASYTVEWKTGL